MQIKFFFHIRPNTFFFQRPRDIGSVDTNNEMERLRESFINCKWLSKLKHCALNLNKMLDLKGFLVVFILCVSLIPTFKKTQINF